MSGWRIVESELALERSGAAESIFAVGNGYLGVRGAAEEGGDAYERGVVLNGFHETWPIVYPEDAYGLARTGQTIVAPPDGSIIRLLVDGEPLDLAAAQVERVLDMRTGVLSREVEWETSRGRRVRVRSRRLASLADRHLAAFDYEVTALDAGVRITLSSELVTHAPKQCAEDPRRGKGFAEKVLQPLAASAHGERAVLELATRSSGLRLACGMDHRIESAAAVVTAQGDAAKAVFEAELAPGGSLRLSKFVAYHWAAVGDLEARVERTLDRAVQIGYDAVEADHGAHVEDFWARSDVAVEGAPDVQLAVRFNLFQLLQATARGEGLGVAAKGVSGRGYEGHYFWDAEIYVVPFLAHTTPDWAKHVLQFRCAMLPAARERAREIGHSGAAYPWRTIDGREASAWYAAGTAQYHISADIAHAMHQYNRVTGDLGFILDQGAEVIFETARLWMELGFFADGGFRINSVTGPDEYTTVVDNNAYTNLMAKQNLEIAVRISEWLAATATEAHGELPTVQEVEGWRRAAVRMFIPRDDELGLVLQDEHFLRRKRWDFDNTPPEKYPLLLHYHPLELYRHQVIKQTDVVLATYLAGEQFSAEEKRRTFDYYDPLTTGDSTLSACIQSVIASEVGHPDAALEYFMRASTVDLHDSHHNTADGIHVATCGGTWLALVAGFAGLRDSDGDVSFRPRLPAEWDRLRFRIQVRGQLIEVDMTHAGTTYLLIEGSGLVIRHEDEELRLVPAAQDLPRAA